MLIKTTFFVLLFSTLIISAQDEIPNKEELLGIWKVSVKDYYSEVREYILLASNGDGNEKIVFKKDGITKSYNTKGTICGNDDRLIYNNLYKNHKTSWEYDKDSGILERYEKHILYGNFFLVKKLDSGNILLTKVE